MPADRTKRKRRGRAEVDEVAGTNDGPKTAANIPNLHTKRLQTLRSWVKIGPKRHGAASIRKQLSSTTLKTPISTEPNIVAASQIQPPTDPFTTAKVLSNFLVQIADLQQQPPYIHPTPVSFKDGTERDLWKKNMIDDDHKRATTAEFWCGPKNKKQTWDSSAVRQKIGWDPTGRAGMRLLGIAML